MEFTYPLVDLKREYRFIKEEVERAVFDVIRQGRFILGDEVKSFEKEFASYCNRKYCVGVSSGTSSLFLALKSIGIQEGDGVIIPALTFRSTAMAVAMAGGRPILVDVEDETGNINPNKIEEKITPYTKAIIPVHLYGFTCYIDLISSISKKYSIPVIEDACEAHGAYYKGKIAGSFGDISCFSFYPSKNMGGYGDGGALLTDDEGIYQRVISMRGYGSNDLLGYNLRLSTLQASVLRVKLKHIDKWNSKRREIANWYFDLLKSTPVKLPPRHKHVNPSYYLFVIRTSHRDALLKHLQGRKIEARVHFSPPIHIDPLFKHLGYQRGDFPVAEKIASEVLSLPMHPFLEKKEVEYIVNCIKEFYKKM